MVNVSFFIEVSFCSTSSRPTIYKSYVVFSSNPEIPNSNSIFFLQSFIVPFAKCPLRLPRLTSYAVGAKLPVGNNAQYVVKSLFVTAEIVAVVFVVSFILGEPDKYCGDVLSVVVNVILSLVLISSLSSTSAAVSVYSASFVKPLTLIVYSVSDFAVVILPDFIISFRLSGFNKSSSETEAVLLLSSPF